MRARLALAVLACLLFAGCGASSGLRVENGGRKVRVTAPASGQPHVADLGPIAFADATHGWAGGRGAIIATADGGTTWARQYAGKADIRAFDFTDDVHGWAVADTALLRTSDGGATWNPAGEPAGMVLTQVDFTTSDQGWGVAVPSGQVGAPVLGTLVRTADGGASWSVVRADFANSVCATGPVVVAGAAATVLRSADGGATWSTVLDAHSSATPWLSAAVQCPDPRSIWALLQGGSAMGSQGYAAYASADAGGHWRPVVVSPQLTGQPDFTGVTQLDSYPGPFDAVSSDKAVFLGQCPACSPQRVAVARTQDGGAHAIRSVVNGFAPTGGLSFGDAQHGWMTARLGGYPGRHPVILATTDGGRSWHPVYPS
jgi:photosystem II stability/assembly factor-like uncharacterized protein